MLIDYFLLKMGYILCEKAIRNYKYTIRILPVPGHMDATVNLKTASHDIEAEDNYFTKCFI